MPASMMRVTLLVMLASSVACGGGGGGPADSAATMPTQAEITSSVCATVVDITDTLQALLEEGAEPVEEINTAFDQAWGALNEAADQFASLGSTELSDWTSEVSEQVAGVQIAYEAGGVAGVVQHTPSLTRVLDDPPPSLIC